MWWRTEWCSADSRGDDSRMREVSISGDGIRLGQLLKLADAVDTGADVKPLLAAGAVRVNGEPEDRRGRQLVRGDVVSIGDDTIRVC
jgi:ribosome-associated protein